MREINISTIKKGTCNASALKLKSLALARNASVGGVIKIIGHYLPTLGHENAPKL